VYIDVGQVSLVLLDQCRFTFALDLDLDLQGHPVHYEDGSKISLLEATESIAHLYLLGIPTRRAITEYVWKFLHGRDQLEMSWSER
jgi:hypothetical protein